MIFKPHFFFFFGLETGGFSDFRFTVNRPPSGGFCEVSPREGVTLSTIFAIKCDAWFDEDTPIKYKIGEYFLFVLFVCRPFSYLLLQI